LSSKLEARSSKEKIEFRLTFSFQLRASSLILIRRRAREAPRNAEGGLSAKPSIE
jgi:hypothetical protein